MRETRFAATALALLLGLIWAPVAHSQAALAPASYRPGESLPVWRLEPVELSGLTEPTQRVIQDPVEFSALWARIYSHTHSLVPVPPVDFAREIVVVVGLGKKATTGYSLHIVNAVYGYPGTVVRVMVSLEEPGQNCAVSPLVSSPVAILRMNKPPVPVVFETYTHRLGCPSP